MRIWFIWLLVSVSLLGCSDTSSSALNVDTIDFNRLFESLELPFGLEILPESLLEDPLAEAQATGIFDLTGIPAPQKMFALQLAHPNRDPSGTLELMVYRDSSEAKKTYTEFQKINRQFDDPPYSAMSLHCHVVLTTALNFDQIPSDAQNQFDTYIQNLESQMNQTFCN